MKLLSGQLSLIAKNIERLSIERCNKWLMKIYIFDRNFSKFLLFRFEKNNQMHKKFQLDDGIDSYLEFIFEINQLTNKETPILYAAIHHKKWHQHFDMELEFVFFCLLQMNLKCFVHKAISIWFSTKTTFRETDKSNRDSLCHRRTGLYLHERIHFSLKSKKNKNINEAFHRN